MSDTLEGLVKEMGDAGYCNYDACREYLSRAILAERERCAKIFAEVLEWLPPASAMDGKHKAAFREFVGRIEHEADAIRRGEGV